MLKDLWVAHRWQAWYTEKKETVEWGVRMKAEREKWSGRVTAKALRFQTGQYELAEEEEICRIILVSGGSFTLVRGGESLLVNPGCVLLLGPGGRGLLQQAGHIAP